MSRQNRVDPWGDLHAVPQRGLFTGNRGCLVNDDSELVRHHNGSLWITCLTKYRDWRHPLGKPRTWTPLFLLDDAVALAAGHRPCGLCRRVDYLGYRSAVTAATGAASPVLAVELNRRLASERHVRGRGVDRADDRLRWTSNLDELPAGVVVTDALSNTPQLVTEHHLQRFSFDGWGESITRPRGTTVEVLTPPTSVAALKHGFAPHLHPTAGSPGAERPVAKRQEREISVRAQRYNRAIR